MRPAPSLPGREKASHGLWKACHCGRGLYLVAVVSTEVPTWARHSNGRQVRHRDLHPVATQLIAFSAFCISARAEFDSKNSDSGPRCARLGIVLAQPASCPQKSPLVPFYPRCQDSAKGDACTGLWPTQVLAGLHKNAVVHTLRGPLLLRLCIYKRDKKKTEGEPCAPNSPRQWAQRGSQAGIAAALQKKTRRIVLRLSIWHAAIRRGNAGRLWWARRIFKLTGVQICRTSMVS